MQSEIIIAGSGGQGILFGGTLLAQSALIENKFTTWFPSYGAEMRGGTANSTVIIADEEIGSPLIVTPSALIALNEQSYLKFALKVVKNGLIIANSSLIHDKNTFKGVKTVWIPATELSDSKLGSAKFANIIALGAFINATGAVKLENAKKACDILMAKKPELMEKNKSALELGFNFK